MSDPTPLEMARSAAEQAPRSQPATMQPDTSTAVTELWSRTISAWSLLSIAESLATIASAPTTGAACGATTRTSLGDEWACVLPKGHPSAHMVGNGGMWTQP